MAIEYRERETGNGHVDVVMTECPFCGKPFGDREGLGDHWRTCPENSRESSRGE